MTGTDALGGDAAVARWVEFQTGGPYIEEILVDPFRIDTYNRAKFLRR